MQKIDFTWVDVVNPKEGRRKLGITDATGTGGPGPPGPPGQGVPAGGTTGQVLTKNSNTNFDTSWQTPSVGGSIQVLQYNSDPTAEGQIPSNQNSPAICYQKDGLGQMFTWNTTTHVWQ